ncbi:uncharacterized protein LOC128240122 [Mya arenaria]|uniref:uncharacterized protein LOC128240122 n=1 Tax=Mya arenaria TaxID=6604 RepID=UPI0022DEFAC8|nr:uncharacterized protein LOC128240122 [Mya arenaria]
MDAMKLVCIVFVLVGFLAGVSDAIKCYECDSIKSPNCKDEFKKKGIPVKENCLECMKTKSSKDGLQILSRTCNLNKLGTTDECKQEKTNGAEVNMCTCYKDGCNGTPRVTIPFISLLTGVLVALKLMH